MARLLSQRGFVYAADMSQSERSILITGCSSGIGYDAAKTLHERGWQVFATCRQEKDCARLRAEGLESFRLDYSETSSLQEAVAEVHKPSGGRLDALALNDTDKLELRVFANAAHEFN